MGGQEKRVFFLIFACTYQKFCFFSYLQRYTVLALWRVINVPKDDLSLLYFWGLPRKSTLRCNDLDEQELFPEVEKLQL
jgi:hypothetical protein